MEDRLITLATDHYTAAEVLKARLEGAGINVFLKHINLIQGAAAEGVKIQIRESDVEKAMELMLEWKQEQVDMDKISAVASIRRILVPVDFSLFSRNACLFALHLAHKYRAEVKILHVYYAPIVDLVPITDAYSIQIDMDINLREMESTARRKLLAFVGEVRNLAKEQGFDDIKIGYAMREGIVEDEIATAARDYKPGIIVLGAKGKGDKQSDIIGSVVHKLMAKTRVPILAIPEKSAFRPANEVRHVAYLTDFDDSDYVALRRLISLLSAFQVKIHCVHVSRDIQHSWSKVRMDALKSYFEKIHPGSKVYCHLLEGENLVGELDAFASTHKIDLLALVSRKRNLIARLLNPGLARKLIYNSHIPLLVFKA